LNSFLKSALFAQPNTTFLLSRSANTWIYPAVSPK